MGRPRQSEGGSGVQREEFKLSDGRTVTIQPPRGRVVIDAVSAIGGILAHGNGQVLAAVEIETVTRKVIDTVLPDMLEGVTLDDVFNSRDPSDYVGVLTRAARMIPLDQIVNEAKNVLGRIAARTRESAGATAGSEPSPA